VTTVSDGSLESDVFFRGDDCSQISSIVVFESFLLPIRVRIVSSESLRVLPNIWTLRRVLW